MVSTSKSASAGGRKRSTPWWRERAPEIGEVTSFAFGPSRTLILREANEWQLLAQPAVPEEPAREVKAQVRRLKSMPHDQKGLQRFIFEKTEPKLTVTPSLADRPVVARPVSALSIPPGVAVRLYISSPLWLRVDVHDSDTHLGEVPIFRPSDIWFGPNTLEGCLCYSSLTHAHLDPANLPHRHHRAITPVVIQNEDADTFRFERMSLPAPYLSIFASDTGELWTDTVTLVRRKGGETTSLELAGTIPDEADGGTQLHGPRETRSEKSLIHAIGEWLG
ncbi:MAG TPA: hypothetical protein VJ961_10240 [Mariprofundaceae bacterium]|nr:hypothetical protein [Mariprofundaceae bacterium]